MIILYVKRLVSFRKRGHGSCSSEMMEKKAEIEVTRCRFSETYTDLNKVLDEITKKKNGKPD